MTFMPNSKRKSIKNFVSLLILFSMLLSFVSPVNALSDEPLSTESETSVETTSTLKEVTSETTGGKSNITPPAEETTPTTIKVEPSNGTQISTGDGSESDPTESESSESLITNTSGVTNGINPRNAILASRNASQWITEPVTIGTTTGLKILGYKGTDITDLAIPDEIDGTNVIAIGRELNTNGSPTANTLQKRGISTLKIGANVKEIDQYSFSDNGLKTIDFSTNKALEKIGNYAFIDNHLTNLILPSTVKEIGEGSFASNKLTDLTLNSGLTKIGKSAFKTNSLSTVIIPDSVTSFGEQVFAYNGKFVNVTTKSTAVPKLEKTADGYGHVIDAISITVKHIDKNTGKPIRSDLTLGTDLTDESNIFVLNQQDTYKTQTIAGYFIAEAVTFTPDSNPYTLVLNYISTKTPPVLTVVSDTTIPVNSSVEEVEIILKNAVKATDLQGKDISEKNYYILECCTKYRYN